MRRVRKQNGFRWGLTRQMRTVACLLFEGLTSKDIAERMGISVKTVNVHRSRINERTGASNAYELARIAGLITDGPVGPDDTWWAQS